MNKPEDCHDEKITSLGLIFRYQVDAFVVDGILWDDFDETNENAMDVRSVLTVGKQSDCFLY